MAFDAGGNRILHAPLSVAGQAVATEIFTPATKPRCTLGDVLPAKTVVLAILLLYVSISTNYLTLSSGTARFIFTHSYFRIIIVFVLSFFIVDYKGPFRIVSRLAAASLITLIYQLVIGITEDANCAKAVQVDCPECKLDDSGRISETP